MSHSIETLDERPPAPLLKETIVPGFIPVVTDPLWRSGAICPPTLTDAILASEVSAGRPLTAEEETLIDSYCAVCPVRDDCLADALLGPHEDTVVRGGIAARYLLALQAEYTARGSIRPSKVIQAMHAQRGQARAPGRPRRVRTRRPAAARQEIWTEDNLLAGLDLLSRGIALTDEGPWTDMVSLHQQTRVRMYSYVRSTVAERLQSDTEGIVLPFAVDRGSAANVAINLAIQHRMLPVEVSEDASVRLSDAEKDLLDLFAAGHNADAVAEKWNVPTGKLSHPKKMLFKKLGAHTMPYAIRRAYELGIYTISAA